MALNLKAWLAAGICAVALLSDCKKGTRLSREYFIFGEVGTECSDCADLYLLRRGRLYGDAETKVRPGANRFAASPLAQEKFNRANTVPQGMPEYLLDRPDSKIGCPGCRDEPSIYIQQKKGYKHHWWMIATDEATMPREIRDYIRQVKMVLEELR